MELMTRERGGGVGKTARGNRDGVLKKMSHGWRCHYTLKNLVH